MDNVQNYDSYINISSQSYRSFECLNFPECLLRCWAVRLYSLASLWHRTHGLHTAFRGMVQSGAYKSVPVSLVPVVNIIDQLSTTPWRLTEEWKYSSTIGTGQKWLVSFTPGHFNFGRSAPVPIRQNAGWAPELLLKLTSAWNRTLANQPLSLTIPTELSRTSQKCWTDDH
jgi:hypothetical protein